MRAGLIWDEMTTSSQKLLSFVKPLAATMRTLGTLSFKALRMRPIISSSKRLLTDSSGQREK